MEQENISATERERRRKIIEHHRRCQSPEAVKKMLETRRRNGSFKLSEETKQKLRLANLGKKYSEETKEKHRVNSTLWTAEHMKGKTYEEIYGIERAKEIKQKLSNWERNFVGWNKGKHLSDEHKLKLRIAKLGKESWKKGKSFIELYGKERAEDIIQRTRNKKIGKPCSDELKQKLRETNKGINKGEKNGMFGKLAWNSGITAETDKRLAHKERHPFYGKHISEEQRKKMLAGLKKKPVWNKGMKREELIKHYPNGFKCGSFAREEHPMYGKRGPLNPNWGKPRSTEIRRKISETQKGRVFTEEHKKKLSISCTGNKYPVDKYPNYGMRGKKMSLENIKKLSERMSGDKHPLWKGGTSFEPYGLDWTSMFKEAIRERDNRCCVVCNKPEEELDRLLSVHHIDYIKRNCFPQNCVSLCRSCHTTTNHNRAHWKTFFQSLLKERYGYEYTVDQKVILDFTTQKNSEEGTLIS